MNTSPRVLVYGASGHTGRFVTHELVRRGVRPVLAGRDDVRLGVAAEQHAGLEHRVFDLGDLEVVRAAIADVAVVINCAGPFLDTALPLARAATEVGAHYLDLTAEQLSTQQLYDELDAPAQASGVAVVPAMAFYGGLADLMLTAALDPGSRADEVEVAIGLDRWWPTPGTRATGARNTSPRQMIRNGHLAPLQSTTRTGSWTFPEPMGDQAVVQLPFSEVNAINRHLRVGSLTSYFTTGALDDLHDPATGAPVAVDRHGRSAQRFVIAVRVRRGSTTRSLMVTGRDIYAVTAPIVVEGAMRLLDGKYLRAGASAPGQTFEATEVLAGLAHHDVDVELGAWSRCPQRPPA